MQTLTPQQQLYFQIIDDLHKKWQPHQAQIDAGRAILHEGCKTLFLQCGRKFGKTEFAIYMLWRQALLVPGSVCYYVGPSMTHARSLIWNDPRLANFGDSKYIASTNSTEMIVKFKNGSFIQIVGSESYSKANGMRPSLLVYDEFGEFHPEFNNVMQPNRVVLKAPLIVIGTPAMGTSINRDQYWALAEECKTRKDSRWIKKTSYENPYIDKEELERERQAYYKRGEAHLWLSYYMAEKVSGGNNVVFPMIHDNHVKPHQTIIDEIYRDFHNLEWYCTADPGTTTVMATLFVAINPYTKFIYILDEIYETKRDRTSVQTTFPIILQKCRELHRDGNFDDDWVKTADEAAAWFMAEVNAQYGYNFMPTLKVHNKKEAGISLIKDMLANHIVVLSDRCTNLFTEMSEYVTKPDGTFIKGKDHLIDALRYTLAAANYSTLEVQKAVEALGPRNPFDLAHGNRFRHLKSNEDSIFDEDWTESAAKYEEFEDW